MTLVSVVGLLGGLCYFIAAVPVALFAFKTGSTSGTPTSTQWLVVGGSVLLLTYFLAQGTRDWFLLSTYAATGSCWAVSLWYMYRPRNK